MASTSRCSSALAVGIASLLFSPVAAQDADSLAEEEEYHRFYIYGVPAEPTEAWIMSRGGRLYDNWMAASGADAPEGTHPLWPASNTDQSGATTWRCKSCHGWDYKGADGQYGEGSYATGIKGISAAAGRPVDDIKAILRGEGHGYGTDMIPDDQLDFLAAFVSRGQDDMDAVIDPATGDVDGAPAAGAAIFQTTCAACHGFDGKALDWGEEGEPAYVGTEANANPWEVLHKIRNAHPGAEMISLRAFTLDDAAKVLAYARSLPED